MQNSAAFCGEAVFLKAAVGFVGDGVFEEVLAVRQTDFRDGAGFSLFGEPMCASWGMPSSLKKDCNVSTTNACELENSNLIAAAGTGALSWGRFRISMNYII